MPEYATILVTTDLSDPALPAVRHAAALAGRLGSRLIAAYVVEASLPPMVLAHSSQSREELLAQHRKTAEKALQENVGEVVGDQPVETVVVVGVVHEEIVKLAVDRGADLLVMGMHGHGFLTHALVGSTAERVLHRAPCPVLVVGQDHRR